MRSGTLAAALAHGRTSAVLSTSTQPSVRRKWEPAVTLPLFLPPSFRRSTRCGRCGLRYPKKDAQCIHCTGLSDSEVKSLKEGHAETLEGNANLGRVFGYIAAVLAASLLLYWFV